MIALASRIASLEPARERAAVGRLGDEMDVIPLDGELQEPKPAAGGLSEGPAQRREDRFRAEGWEPLPRAERHVQRVARLMGRADAVRDTRPVSGRLAAGTGPLPTPRAGAELQLHRTSRHLERADIAEC